MNFAGWIPLHRELIEHTMDGRLSNNEALVLIWLMLLADHQTGSYKINAPALRTFLPDLSPDGAQRALASLERKQYIYRDVKPHSTDVYRYWINGFRPTVGRYKSLQIDLSDVFETNDPSKLRYVRSAAEEGSDLHEITGTYGPRPGKHVAEDASETAPETQAATAPATQPETAKKNNKEKEEVQGTSNKNTAFTGSDEGALASALTNSRNAKSDAISVLAEQRQRPPASAPQVRSKCATGAAQSASPQSSGNYFTTAEPNPDLVGMGFKFVKGRYVSESGMVLSRESGEQLTY